MKMFDCLIYLVAFELNDLDMCLRVPPPINNIGGSIFYSGSGTKSEEISFPYQRKKNAADIETPI